MVIIDKIRSLVYILISRCESCRKNPIRFFLNDKAYFRLKSNVEVYPCLKHYRSECEPGPLRTVVAVFNGEVYNPGLADRLRAIASIYYWSKSSGYDFRIHFSYPFNLSDYLCSNSFDWNMDELDYKAAVPKSIVSYIGVFGEEVNSRLHRNALEELKSLDCSTVHIYSNTCCYDEHFFESFNELFRPNDKLESEIQHFQEEIGGEYITLSFRFARLLGDLEDTVGKDLTAEERVELIATCKRSIRRLVDENNVSRCVVTSDSSTFISEVSDLPYVYVIPGAIGHIANDVNELQVRKTFWDMYIISRARKAYMVRTPIMYRSGFAKRSAMIGNVPYEEVVLTD